MNDVDISRERVKDIVTRLRPGPYMSSYEQQVNSQRLREDADVIIALRDTLDAAEQRAVEAERDRDFHQGENVTLSIGIDRLRAQLATARAAAMEEAARIVDAEPEFPGRAPLGKVLFIMLHPILAVRSACFVTKRKTAAAIRAAIHKEGQSDG